MTGPIRAGVRAEEAFWPQDQAFNEPWGQGDNDSGLAGSGNLMGGRAVV